MFNALTACQFWGNISLPLEITARVVIGGRGSRRKESALCYFVCHNRCLVAGSIWTHGISKRSRCSVTTLEDEKQEASMQRCRERERGCGREGCDLRAAGTTWCLGGVDTFPARSVLWHLRCVYPFLNADNGGSGEGVWQFWPCT